MNERVRTIFTGIPFTVYLENGSRITIALGDHGLVAEIIHIGPDIRFGGTS